MIALACVSVSFSPVRSLGLADRVDVRMTTSWYDAGTRLAGPDLDLVGVVVPTGAAVPKGASDSKALLLQRYLQLRSVLPDCTPLPDSVVEALIVQAEQEAAGQVTVDE